MPSSGLPSGPFSFLISTPSGLFEPTSCSARMCATTRPSSTSGKAMTCSAKKRLSVASRHHVVAADPQREVRADERHRAEQVDDHLRAPVGHLAPGQQVAEERLAHQRQVDQHAEDPHQLARLAVRAVQHGAEHVQVDHDEERRGAGRVDVAQQPAAGHVAHDVLDRAERERGVGLVVHRQEDARDDLDHQHQHRERAEEVPEVEVLRRVVLGGVDLATARPPTACARRTSPTARETSVPIAQAPLFSLSSPITSVRLGRACTAAPSGWSARARRGTRGRRGRTWSRGRGSRSRPPSRAPISALASAAFSCGEQPRWVHTPSITIHSGFSERYSFFAYFGCSDDFDSGSVSRAVDRLQRLEHFLGAADHPHRLAAPLDHRHLARRDAATGRLRPARRPPWRARRAACWRRRAARRRRRRRRRRPTWQPPGCAASCPLFLARSWRWSCCR